MGISTVAVYSEVDKGSKHVRLADNQSHLGVTIDSYLQIEKIIAACEQVRADAVHPGYGFLSENASFSEALKSSKITFIGPPASSIAKMGDKIESKKIAKLAGVSTVPGHEGIISLADNPAKIASEIGYPIMIKASAGGGGKGMRLAHSPDQLVNAISSATREAEASFMIKSFRKHIENPR